MYASFIRALLIVLFTILYWFFVKSKQRYFFLFLVTFSISEILGLSHWFITLESESSIDYIYYICNGLYITSYIFLILQVLNSMSIRDVIIKLPAHIVILVVLDFFCVTIVTDTAKGELSIYQFALEFLYNAVIMSLLTLAVINYIHNVNKKAMNLLIASLFIVFSEMLQLAYFYVIDVNVLNVFCSLFLIIAFFFLYLQATMAESEELNTFKEHLEA